MVATTTITVITIASAAILMSGTVVHLAKMVGQRASVADGIVPAQKEEIAGIRLPRWICQIEVAE
jgi:hypothetical protein